MKKSILAASASAVALAAMPVVGVFAAGESGQTIEETVSVTIPSSCSIRMTNTTGEQGSETTTDITSRTFSKTVAVGSLTIFGGQNAAEQTTPATGTVDLDVYCNETATEASTKWWTLSAVGGTPTAINTNMTGETASNTIATGTATSGDTSNWAFRITKAEGDTAISIKNDYAQFHAIPGEGTVVAYGDVYNLGDDKSVSFAPEYQVYVGHKQASDTYTGKVTYTAAFTETNPGQ